MQTASCPSALVHECSQGDRRKMKAAFVYSQKHLSDKQRRSGESYFQHCTEVALALREASSDSSLLRVALLHDLLVHPKGKRLLKDAPLSEHEKHLVRYMYGLRRLHIDESTKDLDAVIEVLMEEGAVLLLRMAHRLNDVRNISRFKTPLAKRIAYESLHMYSAIAGRLSLNKWRYEMEDICFQLLHPRIVSRLQKQFESSRETDEVCLSHTSRFLQEHLENNGVECSIRSRIKGLYSTYRKMVLKNRAFDQLTDRLALRIVVDDEIECYRALAIVHKYMHPIPGKLKDYIGSPKENGYRSIHTVVYPLPGVTELPMEVQIRSKEMHQLNEYGSLSHGEYKSAVYALDAQPSRVNLFRNLASLRSEVRSPQQFSEVLRSYFREDHLAIFDVQNNLYHIQQPATVLDFIVIAFPKQWRCCKEVRINGRKQSLQSQLHDGDIVDPLFGRSKKVQNEWVHACAHSSTKTTVKQAL